MNFEEGELLLVNKPLEWTSFDVVAKIRNALKKKYRKNIKIGHAGTLDPLATGLLILCTGKKTKTIESLMGLDKVYTGTFFIGAKTASYDREFEPENIMDVSHISEEQINNAAATFLGEQLQKPPVYSAIKIQGEKAYKKARNGEDVVMNFKKIHIHEFSTMQRQEHLIGFKVKCSKGTYIRSLANDFGEKIKTGAYLYSLNRTEIGEFNLENALTVDEIIQLINQIEINHETS